VIANASGETRQNRANHGDIGTNKGKIDRLIDKPSGDSRRSTTIGNNDGEYKRSFVVTFNNPSGDSRQTASDNRSNDRNEEKTVNK
jgi:hypothetical protein